jgi:hypothetical protein
MLLPVAVLVVFLLGAISVDAAVRFQAQREAVADAQSIAHDAVSAVAGGSLREGEAADQAPLDRAEVGRRIAIDDRARRLTGHVVCRLDGTTVTVVVTRRAELVFSPAVPGGRSTADVVGTASARLVDQVSG